MTILQTPVSLQKRQSHKYIYIYEYHSNNCFSAEHQDRKSLKAGKTESQNQGRKTQKKTPFFLQNP